MIPDAIYVPAILPLMALAGSVLSVHRLSGNDSAWRRSVLLGSTLWGTGLVVATESLGVFNALTRGSVAAFWIAAVVAIVLASRKGVRDVLRPSPAGSDTAIRRGFAMALVLLFSTEALIAILAPPMNWDSMTYHLPRVMHWSQNGTTSFFPTHITRQDWLQPGAEYVLLHLQLLCGGDRLLNLVQWLASVGSVIASSAIAAELGAGTAGQWLAAVATATVPMAVLQSSSTQNDLVVGFWLSCMVFSILRFRRTGRLQDALGAGLALGLALLTKGTAGLLAAPFVATVLLPPSARRVKALVLMAVVAMGINAPFLLRNVRVFGSAGGPAAIRETLLNVRHDPGGIGANLLRNAAIHFGTPFEGANRVARRVVLWILGTEANDPGQIWPGATFDIPGSRYREDRDGNPLHLALFLGAVLAMSSSRSRRDVTSTLYVLCLLASFVLFSAALRWQPWHSRLHLPLFLLAGPVIGRALGRGRRHAVAIGSVCLAAVIPWLLGNATRPLIGNWSVFHTPRPWMYFASRPAIARDTLDAVDYLVATDKREVGLVLGGDDYEYPLWALLRQRSRGAVRIRHVNVANETATLPAPAEDFIPQALVTTGPRRPVETVWGPYSPVWSSGPLTVLFPRR